MAERAVALLMLGCVLLLPCAARAGLADRLNDAGLASLTFDDQSLVASDEDGSIRPATVITSTDFGGAFTLPNVTRVLTSFLAFRLSERTQAIPASLPKCLGARPSL